MDEFVTIKKNEQAEIVEKKSKFIANIYYIENVEKAEEIIKQVKKKYFDARHNCVAYRVIENEQILEKSSDDGEPSGTAGAPMLNILQKNNIINVLVIITRYFGGILLGTGGLVRAYSDALIKVLEKSEKVNKCIGYEMQVELEYSDFETFKYYCRKNNINIVKIEYKEDIVCNITLEEDKKHIIIEEYERKNIILKSLKELSKKYIEKCI